MPGSVWLKALACRVGESLPIADLPELRSRPELAERLLATGLNRYSRLRTHPETCAIDCLRSVLAQAKAEPDSIDAILLAGRWDWDGSSPSGISGPAGVIAALGLQRALPIGISLAECANLASAICVGAGLLGRTGFRKILVWIGEYVPGHSSRLAPRGISIYGDAMAGFLLDAEAGGGFRIESMVLETDGRIQTLDPATQFAENFRRTASGMRRAMERLYAENGLGADAYRQIFTCNLNDGIPRLLSRHAGLPESRIFRDNLPRFAHCGAVDPLLNLEAYCLGNPTVPGERFLLFPGAAHIWGALSFQKD